MWNKLKNLHLLQKIRKVRVSRAAILSTVVVLASLAIIFTATAIANRSHKTVKPEGTPSAVPTSTRETPTQNQPIHEEPTDNPPSQETPTEKKDDTPTVSENVVPEFGLPVAGMLSTTYSGNVQVFSKTMKDYRVHPGVDIATAENAEVFAVADGTVAEIWEDPMMGYCISLNHSGDCTTCYKNLAKDCAAGISVGAEIKKGQLLGTIGDSAVLELADEPHLHLEMTVQGTPVNPVDYFSDSVLSALARDDAHEASIGEEK